MRAVVVMLLSLVPGIASATDWAIPSQALGEALPKGCDASSDAGLYDCAAKAFEAADLALNQVWKAVLASIDERAASEAGLTAAQRAAWKSDLTAAQKAWAAPRLQRGAQLRILGRVRAQPGGAELSVRVYHRAHAQPESPLSRPLTR